MLCYEMTNYNFFPQYQQLFKFEDTGWRCSALMKRSWGSKGEQTKHKPGVCPCSKPYQGCISKSTASRSRKLIIQQYLELVRPQLEHCVLIWSPQFQRNIEKLERIQGGVMKTMRRLQNLTWRKFEEIGLGHPREGKGPGECSHSLPIPEMQLERRRTMPFTRMHKMA